ncbi:MAG: threonine/serine exporter family protein [Firmicutes bacterium]|nr:threonine/serine exporter family protein [Bacillota bacterium]
MEHLVGLVLLAGELLLTCGAEMYRVEETIERMGLAAGFVQVEGFATPTGLFISLHTADGRVYTRVRRIRKSFNNLSTIAKVNSLSRAFSEGTVTVDQVGEELERLRLTSEPDTIWWQLIGGIGAMAFTMIFGGNWFEGAIAGLTGALVLVLVAWLNRHPVPKVLQAAIGGIVAAWLILWVSKVLPIDPDVTTLGAVMVMTPGVAMTTAIRDLLSGELLSGLSRSAEALAVSVAIATGVAIVIRLGGR